MDKYYSPRLVVLELWVRSGLLSGSDYDDDANWIGEGGDIITPDNN